MAYPRGDYAAKPLVSCSKAAQPKGTEADGALIYVIPLIKKKPIFFNSALYVVSRLRFVSNRMGFSSHIQSTAIIFDRKLILHGAEALMSVS